MKMQPVLSVLIMQEKTGIGRDGFGLIIDLFSFEDRILSASQNLTTKIKKKF